MFRSLRLILLLVTGLSLVDARAFAQSAQVRVFAAASLKEALDEAAEAFTYQSGSDVVLSYAGSSTLARQIEAGAPVDVFVSANVAWMDELAKKSLIEEASRIVLLGNTLVLIGHQSAPDQIDLNDSKAVVSALGNGPLAMAIVDAVPAGIYGRQAMETLGLWQLVGPKVAQTDNVRAAMALVGLGAAPLGIVYASDAQADPRVVVRAVFPDDSHDKVHYPAAITSRANAAQGKAFLDYLQSSAAHKIFMKHGFIIP